MEIIKNNEAPKIIKSDNIQMKLIKNLEYSNKNDLGFWKDKGFQKIPSGEDFAIGGFQRSEVIILINIVIDLLEVEEDGKFNIEYGETVNHFLRNGSYSTLIGEKNKRKLAYDRFIYLINLIKNFDDNQRLLFLDKLKYIHLQNIRYPEGSNRIELMIGEIENNQLHNN